MVDIRNTHHYKGKVLDPWESYIGRPSSLGNPFQLKAAVNNEQIGRAECIARYDRWLRVQLKDDGSAQTIEIRRLVAVYRQYGKLNLYCYCAPKPCHGGPIKSIIEGLLNEIPDVSG